MIGYGDEETLAYTRALICAMRLHLAREQMANATPEQAQAGMQAWQEWAQRAGSAIVDLGAPLDGEGDVTGFSILQADSRASLEELLAGHPHGDTPGGAIEALEFMAVPGMEE